jgi:hypothetical protein
MLLQVECHDRPIHGRPNGTVRFLHGFRYGVFALGDYGEMSNSAHDAACRVNKMLETTYHTSAPSPP